MIVSIQVTIKSAKRVVEIAEEPEERKNGNVYAEENDGRMVEFKKVSFSYEEREPALIDFDAVLQKNKITALVGPSGCGKSTVTKLLCGFYEDYEGLISIFGGELKQWDIREARARVSVVSQDSFLFPCSVFENISYGNLNATRDEVIEAARMAHADEFIREWPLGYDTMVGERGATLSGGQRQRLAIARAFLKNAPILVLDEPTSALDAHAEAQVQAALERLVANRTVLVIAHRLSTIMEADEIIVMNKGRAVSRGTHRELLQTNQWYRELCEKQNVFSLAEGVAW
ncbi:ABC transporter ATP-binding protein [Cohnella faecalis]|uniref:ABC transporter ATP-binding protein n=1 Tax=Cohnella faecalis TaxID=2315694 RepID=A0A398CNT0_9BACL|nr:ABC transporter ATP-binding protein [Cohnella faecalis]RIE03992.1 ABC transporter ATP-binding protein [Cohnella faecalis]